MQPAAHETVDEIVTCHAAGRRNNNSADGVLPSRVFAAASRLSTVAFADA
jgi:hypothetical protein